MIRLPLFFGFSFVAACAMIGWAAYPALPKDPVLVDGRLEKGALVFDAKSLNHIVSAPGFAVMAEPGPRGDQDGPRLASVSALTPQAEFSKGARLMLGPRALAAIEGRPLVITVFARGLPNVAATKMALGLVGDGPIAWQEADVAPGYRAINFSVPAATKPIKAIALWPATEGQSHGIEIKSLTITTASPVGAP